MFYEASKVFGGRQAVMEGVKLKNPNQFKEAVLFEYLDSMPPKKVEEFVKSPEAKAMVANDMITPDMLERLEAKHKHGHCGVKTTVCHMAKENGDPLWDEFVRCRIQERRLMNALMTKYGQQASPVADKMVAEIQDKCIPEHFKEV